MKTKIIFLMVFVTNLALAQSLLWSKNEPGNPQSFSNCYHVTTDPSGNVISSGYFSGSIDFDPGPGIANLVSNQNCAYVNKLDANGNFVWSVNLPQSSTTAALSNANYALTTDQLGNVIIVGFFNGTCDFDPGPNVFSVTSYTSAIYSYNLFVWKLDAGGNFVWMKQVSLGTVINNCVCDVNGNIFLSGSFNGNCDFDWGVGTTTCTAIGTSDGFISKLDASGNFQYVKQFGSAGNASNITSLALDASSNLYAIGNYSGTIDVDPGSGVHTLTSFNSNYFNVKLNSVGNFVSVLSIDNVSGAKIRSILNDELGNVYVAGTFTGSCDFDPSNASYLLQTSSTSSYYYKLDDQGSLSWALSVDNSSNAPAQMMPQLLHDGGNTVLYGMFTGTIDLDPTGGTYTVSAPGNYYYPYFITLNSLGNFVSAFSPNITGVMDVDAAGNIYISASAGGMGLYINKYGSIYTGIQAYQKNNLNMSLYPNPSKDVCYLNLGDNTGKITIEIYNSIGQKVYEDIVNSSVAELTVDKQNTGIYVVLVKKDSTVLWQTKLIKE